MVEKDLENAQVAALNILQDLQVQKEALTEANAKNEAILASIGDGLVVVDEEGNIIYINKSFEAMLGWKAQEVIGKSMVEVVPTEDIGGIEIPFKEKILSQVLAGERLIADLTNPFYFIRKDKSRFPVRIIVKPVFIEGKIVGAVETFRDITKEKAVEQAKTEFVLLASHQLRTPLAAVKWNTELLVSSPVGQLTRIQLEYLKQITVGIQRMIDLVSALLDVARLELGTLTVESELVDVGSVIKSVLQELAPEIQRKHLDVTEQYGKISTMSFDPRLMRIITQNLINNALNYTPEGGKIKISVEVKDEQLFFTVSDTGVGIPAHQQGQIFTKLFRANNVRTLDTTGTGLGLYLVKSILDRVGGTISFDSKEGKGTTFAVKLPL